MTSRTLVLSLVLALGLPAEGAVLCQKGKRFVFRETCKKKESAVSFVPDVSPGAVLEGLKSVDGAGSGLDADTLRGLAPEQLLPHLVDADGQFVGNTETISFLGTIYRRIGGVPVTLLVSTQTNYFHPNASFYFVDADCTGARLHATSPQRFLPYGTVIGSTVYYSTETEGSMTAYQSRARFEDPCTPPKFLVSEGLCCHNTPGSLPLVPVSSEALVLKPPFRLVLP